MKYGVVQGRLVPQVGDFIQNFPQDNWRDEFEIASTLGVSHIEWIVTQDYPYVINPLFTRDLSPFISRIPVSAVCLDTLMNVNFRRDFVWRRTLITKTLKKMEEQGIKKLVLPLLEEASISDSSAAPFYFLDFLQHCRKTFPDISISLETDLSPEKLHSLLVFADQWGCELGVTFDSGNLTRLGHDLSEHIELTYDWIDNVHVKDCRVEGTTVPLGTGDTDLEMVRRAIKCSNPEYVTFQTARIPGLSEEDVFKYNVRVLDEVLC